MTPRSCGRCRGGPASTPAGAWRNSAAFIDFWCPTMVAGLAPLSWISPVGPIVRASGRSGPRSLGNAFHGRCTCGTRQNCKHVVAVLLALRQQQEQPAVRPSRHRRRGGARHRRPASPAFRSAAEPATGRSGTARRLGEAWLGHPRSEEEDASDRAAPQGQQRMFYVLNAPRCSRGAPTLGLACVSARLRKDGTPGIGYPLQGYRPEAPPRHLRTADRVILARVARRGPATGLISATRSRPTCCAAYWRPGGHAGTRSKVPPWRRVRPAPAASPGWCRRTAPSARRWNWTRPRTIRTAHLARPRSPSACPSPGTSIQRRAWPDRRRLGFRHPSPGASWPHRRCRWRSPRRSQPSWRAWGHGTVSAGAGGSTKTRDAARSGAAASEAHAGATPLRPDRASSRLRLLARLAARSAGGPARLRLRPRQWRPQTALRPPSWSGGAGPTACSATRRASGKQWSGWRRSASCLPAMSRSSCSAMPARRPLRGGATTSCWPPNRTRPTGSTSCSTMSRTWSAVGMVEVAADFPIRLVEPEGGITGRIEEGSGIDWFELHLGVMVEGQPVDLVPALVRLIASGEATELIAAAAEETEDNAPVLLPLADGRLLTLPARQVVPILAALVELFAGRTGAEGEGAGGRFGFVRTEAADLAWLEERSGLALQGGEALRQLGRQLREAAVPSRRCSDPEVSLGTLRPYQAARCRLASSCAAPVSAPSWPTTWASARPCRRWRPWGAARAGATAWSSARPAWSTGRGWSASRPSLTVLDLRTARRGSAARSGRRRGAVTTYAILRIDRERLARRALEARRARRGAGHQEPGQPVARRPLRARGRLPALPCPARRSRTVSTSCGASVHFINPGCSAAAPTSSSRCRAHRRRTTPSRRRLRDIVRPFLLRRTKGEVAHGAAAEDRDRGDGRAARGRARVYEAIRVAMHAEVQAAARRRGLARSPASVSRRSSSCARPLRPAAPEDWRRRRRPVGEARPAAASCSRCCSARDGGAGVLAVHLDAALDRGAAEGSGHGLRAARPATRRPQRRRSPLPGRRGRRCS